MQKENNSKFISKSIVCTHLDWKKQKLDSIVYRTFSQAQLQQHNLQVFLAWDQGPVLWCEEVGGRGGLKQETASLEYIALKISYGAVYCLTKEAAFKLDSLT